MAKIFRVFGYLISPNSDDDYGTRDQLVKELIDYIDPAWPSWWQHLHVDEADIDEWTDDHPLNQTDCSYRTCAGYFDDVDQYLQTAMAVRQLYETYREVGFDKEQSMKLATEYVRVAMEQQVLNMRFNRTTKPETLERLRKKIAKMKEAASDEEQK